MNMQSVQSSNIAAVHHDLATLVLTVQFHNGTRYQYGHVSLALYDALMAAPSKGAFLAREIKAHPELYPCTKLEPDASAGAASKAPQTDLRALRLAYARAIAASEAAAAETARVLIHCVRAEQHRALEDLQVFQGAERDAGRAFLAALDIADPACRRCGCTELNACKGGCHWVYIDPGERPLCSACVGKEAAT
jgi:hypothetical protein